MAFRFAPTEMYSSANKANMFIALIRWNPTAAAWEIISPRPRFSVSGTATAPVLTIPGVEGAFLGAVAFYNGAAALVAQRANTVISGANAVTTVTLSGAATALTDTVAIHVTWDEQPIRS